MGMLSRSVFSLAVDTKKLCHWVFPCFLILLFGGVAATQESLPEVHLDDDQLVDGEFLGRIRRERGVELIDISNNLGDTKSLTTHPATTTHQRLTPEARDHLGIGDGLIRLSVGLEDAEDIKEDLARGLKASSS